MRRSPLIVLVSSALLLAACSNGGAGEQAAAEATPEVVTETVTATVTETVTAPAETVTVEPTQEEVRPTEDSDEEDDGLGDVTELEIPEEGKELGLDDFFEQGSFEEGRWNVANREGERGIAVFVNSVRPYDLELRLQNQFETLSFDAGQANDSRDSSCLAKVDVFVDGELRETQEFRFNAISELHDIDVRDGNAVVIEVSKSECRDATRVVLSRIKVE